MIAGTMPSRTSVKTNVAVSAATTTSAAASNPTPPPRAAPCTRATTGFGEAATAANNPCVRSASASFSAAEAPRMLFM
jgi:hypothetical protein